MQFIWKTNRSRKRNRKAGFSLIETMMGSMVMTMVLAGSFTALSRGVDLANQARSEQFADRLLNNEISYLRTLSWEDIDSSNVDGLRDKTYTEAQTLAFFKTTRGFVDADIPMRDLQLTVDFNKTHSGSRKHIELTLDWKEINGRSMTRTATFSYSKDGINDSFCPVL